MTTTSEVRAVEIFLEGSAEPLWVVRDNSVPLPEDLIFIENADGLGKTYKIVKRIWGTAKQGESSFMRIRLTVKEVSDGYDWSKAV